LRASVGSTEAPERYFRGPMLLCMHVTIEACSLASNLDELRCDYAQRSRTPAPGSWGRRGRTLHNRGLGIRCTQPTAGKSAGSPPRPFCRRAAPGRRPRAMGPDHGGPHRPARPRDVGRRLGSVPRHRRGPAEVSDDPCRRPRTASGGCSGAGGGPPRAVRRDRADLSPRSPILRPGRVHFRLKQNRAPRRAAPEGSSKPPRDREHGPAQRRIIMDGCIPLCSIPKSPTLPYNQYASVSQKPIPTGRSVRGCVAPSPCPYAR
jgi:hypothetical protein